MRLLLDGNQALKAYKLAQKPSKWVKIILRLIGKVRFDYPFKVNNQQRVSFKVYNI